MGDFISQSWKGLSTWRQWALGIVAARIVWWLFDKGLTLFYEKVLERSFSWDDWGALMGFIQGILTDRLFTGFVIAAALFGLGPIIMSFLGRMTQGAGFVKKTKKTITSPNSIKDNSEFDIIEKGVKVFATRTDDGINVFPVLYYRNRSQRNLHFKDAKVKYILNGQNPVGGASEGLSTPIPMEKDSSVRFKPIRIYNESGYAKGEILFQFTYGETKESARTKVVFKYEIETLSRPKEKGKIEEIDANVSGGATYQVLRPDQSDSK